MSSTLSAGNRIVMTTRGAPWPDVYGWFTEGFATADLVAARELLASRT
jgi:hypothetical protein